MHRSARGAAVIRCAWSRVKGFTAELQLLVVLMLRLICGFMKVETTSSTQPADVINLKISTKTRRNMETKEKTDTRRHLVVFAIQHGDEGDEGESHDGHQRELPRHPAHEDEVPDGLDAASQEDVDVLGDEVAHLGGVSRQA